MVPAALIGVGALISVGSVLFGAADSPLMLLGWLFMIVGFTKTLRGRIHRPVLRIGAAFLIASLAGVIVVSLETSEARAAREARQAQREQERKQEQAKKKSAEPEFKLPPELKAYDEVHAEKDRAEKLAAEAAAFRAKLYAPAPPPPSGVTMANYLRIEPGMSYQQVVDILGEPGESLAGRSWPGTPRSCMHGSSLDQSGT